MIFDWGGHEFMMRLYFGLDEKADMGIDGFFNNVYEDEWFGDDEVKQIVKDIDNSEVVTANHILSPYLGPIGAKKISGGAKGLIMLLKYRPSVDDDIFYPDLAIFGENCMGWLGKISKKVDFDASIYTNDLPYPGVPCLCVNDGDIVDSESMWVNKQIVYF